MSLDDHDYDVGYKRPPKHRQFKPGQSGNPRGRPRRENHLATALGKALRKTVSVRQNGQQKQMTIVEALVESLLVRALSGKCADAARLLKLIQLYAPEQLKPKPEDLCVQVTYVYSDDPRALKPPPLDRLPKEQRSSLRRGQ